MAQLNIDSMNTLDQVKAQGNLGFFVGATAGSLVLSYQGKVYLFGTEGITGIQQVKKFCNDYFGIMCDPKFAEENKHVTDNLFEVKPEVFPMVVLLEGEVLPIMFIPNSDIQIVIDSVETEDTTEGKVFH